MRRRGVSPFLTGEALRRRTASTSEKQQQPASVLLGPDEQVLLTFSNK